MHIVSHIEDKQNRLLFPSCWERLSKKKDFFMSEGMLGIVCDNKKKTQKAKVVIICKSFKPLFI